MVDDMVCNSKYRSGQGRYQNMYNVVRAMGGHSEQTHAEILHFLEGIYTKSMTHPAQWRRGALIRMENYARNVVSYLMDHEDDALHVFPTKGRRVVGAYVRAHHAFRTGNPRALERAVASIRKLHNCALDVVLYGATRTWNRILRQVRRRGPGNVRTPHAVALTLFSTYLE